MPPRRRPFDPATVPVPLRDGRFAVELRFRIDASAPEERVTALLRTLRWRPERIAILFAIPRRGLRAVRIEGPDVGEVYTLANRVADAIREIGDIVREEPAASTPLDAGAEVQAAGVTTGSVDEGPRWTYEPPDAFLDVAPSGSGVPARRGVMAFLSGLLRRR
jgi:hypothetical protein